MVPGPARTLDPLRGWIVISHIGCEREQRLPYKGLDIFTIMTRFKTVRGGRLRAC